MSMFSQPASASSIQMGDHLGKLLLVEPTSHEKDIKTVHGLKDAIRATVTVLGDGQPEVIEDSLIFGGVLIGQLRSRIGEKVLGRLSQGDAKPGQDPPWKMLDATEDEIAKATAYVTQRDAAKVTSARAPF